MDGSRALPPMAWRWVGLVMAVKLLLHLAASGSYGYFRDELYFLDCARHLQWGYVDDAPGIVWLFKGALLLGGSLPVIRAVEKKLNLHITHARQLIQSVLAGPEAARRLGLAADTPILRIRRVYYAAGGRPVEVAVLRHHPDRYQYEIELRSRSGRF